MVQVTKAIDVAEDEDMELLAEFFKGKLDAATIKYVADRDSILVEQLKTFKSKYGKGWSEEECKGDTPRFWSIPLWEGRPDPDFMPASREIVAGGHSHRSDKESWPDATSIRLVELNGSDFS